MYASVHSTTKRPEVFRVSRETYWGVSDTAFWYAEVCYGALRFVYSMGVF